jgi:hypothetical protein
MLIHGRKSRVYEQPKLKVSLGPNAIEMVRQHRILGLALKTLEPIHNKCVKTIDKFGDIGMDTMKVDNESAQLQPDPINDRRRQVPGLHHV